MVTIKDLIEKAFKITGEYHPSEQVSSGSVGAALMTKNGNVFTGVCIDAACGLGFCAEHAAIAEMLKHKESEIVMLVAVNHHGTILPPCGRCRELMRQVNPANMDSNIVVDKTNTVTLRELLPQHWLDVWK